MAGPTYEKLTPSSGCVLQKILNALNLSPNENCKDDVVLFLRHFFEFQHHAAIETLLALGQSTCEQIFDILLQSMDDSPDVFENACYAVCFLAKCCPFRNALSKFSDKCVCSLHIAAHNDVGESGMRMAAYDALHEVVRYVAAPVIRTLINHVACDLGKALYAMDTKYGEKYIQYECRGLKIILHKLGESEVTESSFKEQLEGFAEFLFEVFIRTNDVGCWKDAMIAIGALAHAIGPAFEKHMLKFFTTLISGLQNMREGELYDSVVGVVIKLSRALKGKILPYCEDILSQLHQDLLSTDLHEITKCSTLCCYSELALAIGADFHNYLANTMDALRKLTSSKRDVLLKAENRPLICAILETYFAIIRCFEEPSESHRLSPFASDILDFLRLICGLDMDAMVTTNAILLVRRLTAVPGEIFCFLVAEDKSIQSFLNQCSISKDPLIKACADRANSDLLDRTYDSRCKSLESKVSKKLLSMLQDQENEYSEDHLLSMFHNLSQGVDSDEENCVDSDEENCVDSDEENCVDSDEENCVGSDEENCMDYEQNSMIYVSLSSILSKDEEHFSSRILAGKILLTALRCKKRGNRLDDDSNSLEDESNSLDDESNGLDDESICCISRCLVRTLSSCEAEACSMAIEILKHIGELSEGFNPIWDELEEYLCSDREHPQLHVKYTFEMLADVLKNLDAFSDRPSEALINKLHNAIDIKASEHNDDVICNLLQILRYSYCSPKFLSKEIREFIFDSTKSAKVKVKVAALECLTALCSSHGFDPLEQNQVRTIMLEPIKEIDEWVTYQAIVFWIQVCQKEMHEVEQIFVMEISESLVTHLLKILFARSTQLLESTDPYQHKETQNLAKAALRCLHFVAQTIGNKIIQLVEKDVILGIESSDVWHKVAGIEAFGSILVGPTREALSSLFTSAFSKIVHALDVCMAKPVSYALIWTLSQICELHSPIAKPLVVKGNMRVIRFWMYRVESGPFFSKNGFHALSSLVQGGDAYIWVYLTTPRFHSLLHVLHSVGRNDSDGFSELNGAAYEALHECMKCANDKNLAEVLCVATYILDDLSRALKAGKYTIEGLKNQCRSLLVMVQKLGKSEKYSEAHDVHDIITLLTRVLECGNVIVCKEAILAVGAIAYVNGGAFEQHMEKLEKCWEVGVQFSGQHMEVYLVMLSVIVDVCRALKKKMLQFCDKNIIPLFIDISHSHPTDNWGPSISCICSIAVAVGDEKFLKHAMDMLRDKKWFGIGCVHRFDWQNIRCFRPGLVEAYRAIFQGLKNCPVSDPFDLFAHDTLDVLLEFSNSLYQENDMDHVITRRFIDVLEHLAVRKECSMRDLISQCRLLKYSNLNQGLVDHLCNFSSRPSLIKLVQDSFQNEGSEGTDMDPVGGYRLVEVYAVHVKTKQPRDLYGAIRVYAGILSPCLYNQERGDAEPVSSGETALNFGGLETIPGVEGITLEVDLKHRVGDGGPSTDVEVCRNKTTMISGGDVRKGYNRPLEATIEGKIASVRISFIEYDCATTAYVKVSVLLPREGIHGQITAYTMRYPSVRRELFRRNSMNGVILTRETFRKLNLYEGVVVVPLNSTFVVKADLWRKLVGHQMGQSSIPFMKFSAEFNVTPDGSASKAYTPEASTATIIIEVFFGI